jgi:hypothetical protein
MDPFTPGSLVCGRCGVVYAPDPEWTEDDAAREHEALFGVPPAEDSAVVCEDCYQAFLRWFKAAFN